MGLTTGPNGVKEFVTTTCPDATHEMSALKDVHAKYHCNAREVFAILDGNVLVRQIPGELTSFDEYSKLFCTFIEQALDAADLVAIVFDDFVTGAKKTEQEKRDASAGKRAIVCSADLDDVIPKTDDYTFEKLCEVNPHDLISQRRARPRFFDAVCKRTLIALLPRLQRENKRLLFDGVDPRGADRPAGEERNPTMVSNDYNLAERLKRPRDKPVGEGDLKVTDLSSEAMYMRDTREDFLELKLTLIVTIDTDSIAIELMHQGSKLEQQQKCPDLSPPVVTLLCFRNRKSSRVPKDDDTPAGVYTCLDIEDAHAGLLARMNTPPGYERHAISLLCVLWAVQKSDFIFTPGSKKAIDRFVDVQTLCANTKRAKRTLALMRYSWDMERQADAAAREKARSALCRCFTAVLGADTPDMTLARAAWISIYWSGLQLPDEQLPEWGFPCTAAVV